MTPLLLLSAMAVIWRAATVASGSILLKSNDTSAEITNCAFVCFPYVSTRSALGCGEEARLTEYGGVLRGDARIRDGIGHVSKLILILISPDMEGCCHVSRCVGRPPTHDVCS